MNSLNIKRKIFPEGNQKKLMCFFETRFQIRWRVYFSFIVVKSKSFCETLPDFTSKCLRKANTCFIFLLLIEFLHSKFQPYSCKTFSRFASVRDHFYQFVFFFCLPFTEYIVYLLTSTEIFSDTHTES